MKNLVHYLIDKNPLKLAKIQEVPYGFNKDYSYVVKSSFKTSQDKKQQYSLVVRSCLGKNESYMQDKEQQYSLVVRSCL